MRIYASAGAVVVTGERGNPEVLFLDQVRKNGEQQTVCPKGRLEPGESAWAAALREVTEEAGITDLTYIAFLGRQSYSFIDSDSTRANKSVDWFLFYTADRATTPATAEGFISARWVSAIEASQVASHAVFGDVLERALAILAWRASALPVSAALHSMVRDVAAGSAKLLRGHPEAGVGLCGSAARGDFVVGWSDVDVIGWGIPMGSGIMCQLTQMVTAAATDHAVPASLRLWDPLNVADLAGQAKLSAVLARADREVAIIAGNPPNTARFPLRPATLDIAAFIDAVNEYLRLIGPESLEGMTIRRILAALTNAARIIAAVINPDTGLRLPEVIETLADLLPDPQPVQLLRTYDQFRRSESQVMAVAEKIARQVPEALAVMAQFLNQQPTP
jgi:8-oxo-dGTP pyrophosphatase MutT (NUDIX family)